MARRGRLRSWSPRRLKARPVRSNQSAGTMANRDPRVRTHYRNGDEITLMGGCDSCSPSRINGVFCHEQGCPDAWRDYSIACRECGCEFLREERHQAVCNDCVEGSEPQ
jgi:hypothetical protein